MTTTEIANKLVVLCRQGKSLEAIDTLYASAVVSVEPMPTPPLPAESHGIDAVKKKAAWWAESHEVHQATVIGPFVAGDRFILNYDFDATNRQTGKSERHVRVRPIHGGQREDLPRGIFLPGVLNWGR